MKRIFLIIALAVSVLACTAEAPVKKDVSVQLYSVRDLLGNPDKYAKNGAEVMKGLAEMGYTSVEAANYNAGKFYGRTPTEFKADVEAAGLKVLSSHVGHSLSAEELESGDFSKSMAWWDECIAAHKAAGMKYVVTPSMPIPETLKDLKTYCEYYNAIGKKCNENGMLYGFHNHAREFEKIEDVVMMDYMLQNTDPSLVFFQMDVYWAVIGNASPVEYFEKYPGRFKVLHIKDSKEIGHSGMVGFDAIFNNAATAGMKDFVVEVERYSNEDRMVSMKESVDYLLAAPFVASTYNK